MFLVSLAAASVASPLVPWPRLRMSLNLIVLCVIAFVTFQSYTIPHSARWPSMVILGLAMVAASAEALVPFSYLFGRAFRAAARSPRSYRLAGEDLAWPDALRRRPWVCRSEGDKEISRPPGLE